MTADNPKIQSAPKTPSLDEQQQYWDERWDRQKMPNAYQLTRSEKVLEYIRSLPLDQPKILDLGCGTGWFTEQLSHLGDTIGTDLSEVAIDVARSRFPHVNYIAGNLYELSFPQESFDIIVSQEVIAHVEDQVKLMEIMTQLLKPQGYLILTTVNKFVIERTYQGPDPSAHIKDWLSMKTLKFLLDPDYRLLKSTTVIPMGNRGILRLVNSYIFNAPMRLFISRDRLDALKGWAGCGYTRVLLAQKKA